jgi:glucosamine--fructose-6-phosphate aminotransferase (isomerizing)
MAQGRDTLNEIENQFDTWAGLIEDLELLQKDVSANFAVREYDDVLFIGAGSSHHLAVAAAATFRRITGEAAIAAAASEILFFHKNILKPERQYLVVLFSRSGATTETLAAAALLRDNYRSAFVAVTCDPASPLCRFAEVSFPVKNCVERSLIMTKSFTSMLLLSYMFSVSYAEKFTYLNTMEIMPEEGRAAFEQQARAIDRLVRELDDQHVTYLGGGPYLGLAREAALKRDEMARTHSLAMPPLEMRHGPKTAVRPGDIIVALLSTAARREEMVLLYELRQLGARTLVLADKREPEIDEVADTLILTGRGIADDFRGLLYMPFLQYLGCQYAIKKGIDPDSPENLTRVVQL